MAAPVDLPYHLICVTRRLSRVTLNSLAGELSGAGWWIWDVRLILRYNNPFC